MATAVSVIAKVCTTNQVLLSYSGGERNGCIPTVYRPFSLGIPYFTPTKSQHPSPLRRHGFVSVFLTYNVLIIWLFVSIANRTIT